MVTIQTLDYWHVRAADGWLGLGDPEEASRELSKVSPEYQQHPDVLQLRWQLLAQQGDWDGCLDIATTLTQVTPERRFGWIHKAFSLHKLGRTDEACEVLLDALHHFGPNATMYWYLARFHGACGRLLAAREWLEQAFAMASDESDKVTLRRRALDEPDLTGLRELAS